MIKFEVSINTPGIQVCDESRSINLDSPSSNYEIRGGAFNQFRLNVIRFCSYFLFFVQNYFPAFSISSQFAKNYVLQKFQLNLNLQKMLTLFK